MSERLAICPGSFDPVTLGHLDIMRRASELFDRVIVLVSVNADKTPSFSAEERMEMIKAVTSDIPNLTVERLDGLLADYVRESGACAIVKGLRAMTDFEYEFQMALINKKLYAGAETVFLVTQSENMYLSSSLVRQIASFGGDISGFVPGVIADRIMKRFSQNGRSEERELK